MAATLVRHYGGGAVDAHDVEERVMRVLNSFSKIDQSKVPFFHFFLLSFSNASPLEPSQLSKDSHFIKDLGLNSLDAVEIVMVLEEEFTIEIPDEHAEKILSPADAIKYVVAHPSAA